MGGAVEDAPAKQRCGQIDHQARGLAAIIEKRVKLDEIERRHQIAVVEDLHHKMGLAEGRATGHRGAHGGRNRRIKEINVERDMQQAVTDYADMLNVRWMHVPPARLDRGRIVTVTQGSPGWPDLLLAKDKRLAVIELKVGYNRPTQAQQDWLDDMPNSYVCRSFDEARPIVDWVAGKSELPGPKALKAAA